MFVEERKWTSYLLRGIVALAFGIVLWAWPGVTVGWIIVLFGIWAIVSGIIVALVALLTREPGWGWRLFGGLCYLVLGIIVVSNPHWTALTVLYLIAIYAIINGVVEIVSGLKWGYGTGTKVLFVILGLISFIFGIWAFADPKGGATAILWLIALYATLSGIFTIILSFFVRSMQKNDGGGEPLTPAAA
jgi:uncharacterized membrane protein HdeD (DUF308 family)